MTAVQLIKDVEKDLKRDVRVGFVGMGISNRAIFHSLHGLVKDITLRGGGNTDGIAATRYFIGDSAFESIDEDILFLSPSVRRDRRELIDAEARGVILSSDCDMFFAEPQGQIYTVTGSDGKSTTTELARRLLTEGGSDAIAVGNIGVPYACCEDGYGKAVCELSSFNLQYLTPRSHRCVITNVTPNHLDWHRDYSEYRECKLRITEHAGGIVVPFDDEIMAGVDGRELFAVFSTELPHEALARYAEHTGTVADGYISVDGRRIIATEELGRREEYNVKNLLAAILLTLGDASDEDIRSVARSFRGLKHRSEIICSHGGIDYIDSSIDTTPERCARTLVSLGRRVKILLGGRGKGLSYEPLTEPLIRFAAAIAIYGEDGDRIYGLVEKEKGLCGVPVYRFSRFDDAVVALLGDTSRCDAVILSPAATSYGEFRNYEERADRFRRLVSEYIKSKG